jgi:hypothetical protein
MNEGMLSGDSAVYEVLTFGYRSEVCISSSLITLCGPVI